MMEFEDRGAVEEMLAKMKESGVEDRMSSVVKKMEADELEIERLRRLLDESTVRVYHDGRRSGLTRAAEIANAWLEAYQPSEQISNATDMISEIVAAIESERDKETG